MLLLTSKNYTLFQKVFPLWCHIGLASKKRNKKQWFSRFLCRRIKVDHLVILWDLIFLIECWSHDIVAYVENLFKLKKLGFHFLKYFVLLMFHVLFGVKIRPERINYSKVENSEDKSEKENLVFSSHKYCVVCI